MNDVLREELEGLKESWLDDACRHREPSDPVSDAVAEAYQECADEIEALLKRHIPAIKHCEHGAAEVDS